MFRPFLGSLTVAAALASGLSACGADSSGPRVLEVPRQYKTIQAAVDDARWGDLVLIERGTYHEAVRVRTSGIVIRGVDRNRVVLDGRDELSNGFEVRSDQVAIENLTVQRFAVNGVLIQGHDRGGSPSRPRPTGWRAAHVTAANNGLYGFYAFATGPGSFENDLATGHPDSGIYVGQCRACGALVIGNVLEHNAIGFEDTNASDVVVAENIVRHNRVGMVIASADSELLAPQTQATVVANLVEDNDDPGAPATNGAFGSGIVVAGGRSNSLLGNRVSGHPGVAILVIDQDGHRPAHNTITRNRLSGNGTDLGYASEAGEAIGSAGNCFDAGQALTTFPANLTRLLPCPAGRHASLPAQQLDLPDSPPPVDYRLIAPSPQRQGLASRWLRRWRVPLARPRTRGTASFHVPGD